MAPFTSKYFDQSTHNAVLAHGFSGWRELDGKHEYSRYRPNENSRFPEETGDSIVLDPETGDWEFGVVGASAHKNNSFGRGHDSLVRHLKKVGQ